MALSGNTLVVGSPLDDNEAAGISNSGSAYVFTGSGATWTEQAKLLASKEANGDQFGTAVDIEGDMIAVGARFVDNGANTLQGAAYVFTRTGTTWVEQARLLASDGASGRQFWSLGFSERQHSGSRFAFSQHGSELRSGRGLSFQSFGFDLDSIANSNGKRRQRRTTNLESQ